MAYSIGILIVAVSVFLVGQLFNLPMYILAMVSIILGGYGIYEFAFGRKDDADRLEAQRKAARLQREKKEAENRQRQLEEERRRKKELDDQNARWTALFNQMKADHQVEMNRLMERISSISDERITQVSKQISELAQKYRSSSIISNLSAQEIEEEVKKRETQIRAESQIILNKALGDAEAKHKNQLAVMQSAIQDKYNKLMHEKERAYSDDLSRQSKELEKVRQDMKREQDQMAAQLNDQHEKNLAKVKIEFEANQKQAIAAVTEELDRAKEKNAKLEAEKESIQKELETRLAEMEKRGESKHYQDKQIYDLLLRMMGQVKYRMDIICPWASHGVVNDNFLKKIAKMADRDVDLYICYGYSEKDKRMPETEKCLKEIESVYKRKGKADKINIRFRKTHEKIIMVDDDLYFSTSCNVLSNPVVNGTGEGGILFHDKKSVAYRRKKDFGFSGTVYFTDIGKPKV